MGYGRREKKANGCHAMAVSVGKKKEEENSRGVWVGASRHLAEGREKEFKEGEGV